MGEVKLLTAAEWLKLKGYLPFDNIVTVAMKDYAKYRYYRLQLTAPEELLGAKAWLLKLERLDAVTACSVDNGFESQMNAYATYYVSQSALNETAAPAEKPKKRIYISGQITGLDIRVAENAFEYMANKLALAGFEAVNPMTVLPYDPKYTWHDYMAEDLKVLLYCDGILMLDNWTNSKGAKIELAVAQGLGLPVYYSQNHNLF
jgi:hypothetical protein